MLQRLERLRPEVQRLHGILESFLRFARVQELKLEPTDLNTVIDELRDFYEPHAATKGIVIRTKFARDLPLVPAGSRAVQAGRLEPGSECRARDARRAAS